MSAHSEDIQYLTEEFESCQEQLPDRSGEGADLEETCGYYGERLVLRAQQ